MTFWKDLRYRSTQKVGVIAFWDLIGINWKIPVIKDINHNLDYSTLTNCECSFQ